MTTQTTPKVAAGVKTSSEVYLLLKTGQLIGPFSSRQVAKYWAASLELPAHSTYDPIRPEHFRSITEKEE